MGFALDYVSIIILLKYTFRHNIKNAYHMNQMMNEAVCLNDKPLFHIIDYDLVNAISITVITTAHWAA